MRFIPRVEEVSQNLNASLQGNLVLSPLSLNRHATRRLHQYVYSNTTELLVGVPDPIIPLHPSAILHNLLHVLLIASSLNGCQRIHGIQHV